MPKEKCIAQQSLKERREFTIKDFQENLPVGGNADVFLVDMVI